MIDFLHGSIINLEKQRITIMVGGIGYGIQIPDEHRYALHQEIKLYIYTHWNQEQGPSLFGFASNLDKTVFQLIISCSGIGPKIGLATLAYMSSPDFIAAITHRDIKSLAAISGIGTKKAESIIINLQSKIEKLINSTIDLGAIHNDIKQYSEVSQVLESLHYSKSEIAQAFEFIKKQNNETQNYADLSFDKLLRTTLKYLSK